MSHPSAYHQLGKFVVRFQHLEGAVNEMLVLLADAEDEVVRILVNDLEYSRRLNTLDVLFAHFVDVRRGTDEAMKAEFHKLMGELSKLGTRRNELVHSKYFPWVNADGKEWLLRRNSQLRASKGQREEIEYEHQPEAFDADLERLSAAANNLERFRRQIIDWLYPDEP
jgi:hypothetical protein